MLDRETLSSITIFSIDLIESYLTLVQFYRLPFMDYWQPKGLDHCIVSSGRCIIDYNFTTGNTISIFYAN